MTGCKLCKLGITEIRIAWRFHTFRVSEVRSVICPECRGTGHKHLVKNGSACYALAVTGRTTA